MKKNSWSKDELQTLRLYAAEGRSIYRISAALDRTVATVRTMANRLGLSIHATKPVRSSISETTSPH